MFPFLLVVGCKRGSDTTRETPAKPDDSRVEVTCGELRCSRFATLSEAVSSVLASGPRVIAFGESHALRGAPDVLTATERFGSDILPLLRTRGATVLVVELVNPPQGCETDRAAVTTLQKPVVEQQDPGNQGRFVELGHRAKALGITPLILEPACSEFSAVRQADLDGVAALLELIAKQTQQKVERLVARAGPQEIIVAYGGAIHNDVAEPSETLPFAFGAALRDATHGSYIAVDLIVPEFVGDTETWRALPWYPYWPGLEGPGVTLIEVGPREFTIILERGQRRAATSPQSNTGSQW